jgi:hypothetical protein
MALTDLFNQTFFMFLGILVLVVALLVVYFESKFRDQNHKISSMLSLVSSLAEEVNGTKMIIHQLTMNPQMQQHVPFFQNKEYTLERKIVQSNDNLIPVSDDEDSDDESEVYVDSDDEDSVSDDEASEVSDSDSDSDEKPNTDIKVFRLTISEDLNQIDEDSKSLSENSVTENSVAENSVAENSVAESLDGASLEDLDDLDGASLEDLDDLDDTSSTSSDSIQETKTAHVKKIDNFMDLKSINITLEETKTDQSVDYKKMALPKLRRVVSEKGLSSDSSKLKKNELLKLLGVE